MTAPLPHDDQSADHDAVRARYAEQLSPDWAAAHPAARAAIGNAAVRGPSLADAAMSTIRGGTDAQHLIATLRGGCAPEDALLDALLAVLKFSDAERTRGFMRELQKRLERT